MDAVVFSRESPPAAAKTVYVVLAEGAEARVRPDDVHKTVFIVVPAAAMDHVEPYVAGFIDGARAAKRNFVRTLGLPPIAADTETLAVVTGASECALPVGSYRQTKKT